MPNSRPPKRPNKFLVVDDQRSVRAYARAMLAEFGGEIVEALRLIGGRQFDLCCPSVLMRCRRMYSPRVMRAQSVI